MRVLNVYVSCRLEYIVPQFLAPPSPSPSNKAGWAFTVNCSGILMYITENFYFHYYISFELCMKHLYYHCCIKVFVQVTELTCKNFICFVFCNKQNLNFLSTPSIELFSLLHKLVHGHSVYNLSPFQIVFTQ